MRKNWVKRAMAGLISAVMCVGLAAAAPVQAAADGTEDIYKAYYDILVKLRQDEEDELIAVKWVSIRDICGDSSPELIYVVSDLDYNGPYIANLYIYTDSEALTADTYVDSNGKEVFCSVIGVGTGYNYDVFMTNDGLLWVTPDYDHVDYLYCSYKFTDGCFTGYDYLGVSWYADPEQENQPFINDKDITLEEFQNYIRDIESRRTITIIECSSGKLTGDYLTLDKALSYTASLIGNSFFDTPTTDWYYKYVEWAAGHGIVSGYPDNTFRPSNTMTRAELVQVLYNLAGKPAVAVSAVFSDVSASDWYSAAVSWAASAGVTSGVGGGLFNPAGSVTREQAVMFLFKYAQLNGDSKNYSGVALSFGDKDAISPWAIPAVQWSAANGVVGGYPDGTFGPANTATRAEVVTILYEYMN